MIFCAPAASPVSMSALIAFFCSSENVTPTRVMPIPLDGVIQRLAKLYRATCRSVPIVWHMFSMASVA